MSKYAEKPKTMKALGIAFSARERGNCLNCTDYVLAQLEKQGFKTDIINIYDFEIKPCSHCKYECFAQELRGKHERCPIQDDASKVYDKMKKADIIVLAVPTYGGKPASLYCAFTERGQGIIKSYEEFRDTILSKIMGLIVIGNTPAGGDLTYHTVVMDYRDCKDPPRTLLLQAAEYGQISLRGTLIKDATVRNQLDSFVKSIIKDLKSRS